MPHNPTTQPTSPAEIQKRNEALHVIAGGNFYSAVSIEDRPSILGDFLRHKKPWKGFPSVSKDLSRYLTKQSANRKLARLTRAIWIRNSTFHFHWPSIAIRITDPITRHESMINLARAFPFALREKDVTWFFSQQSFLDHLEFAVWKFYKHDPLVDPGLRQEGLFDSHPRKVVARNRSVILGCDASRGDMESLVAMDAMVNRKTEPESADGPPFAGIII
ncbi:hypothetical protein HDU98_001610 [Podochytrium sp. JEL0797]|nr:hypothetical protein HDU98_001610 [Podochytrium sp. JEL0797]